MQQKYVKLQVDYCVTFVIGPNDYLTYLEKNLQSVSLRRLEMYLKIIFVISFIELSSGKEEVKLRLPRLQCIPPRKVSGCAGEGYRSVAPHDTYFFLYTRGNSDEAEFLQNCNNSVPANTNFKAESSTVIIIFGFLDDVCNFAAMREMKDQFLIRDDYNVILVDWSWGNVIDFLENKLIVARQIAQLIENIKRETGADGDKFHLIGHSVGGNLVGLTGRLTKVGRITSLDPAGATVYGKPEDYHVLKSDAKMVDVMHTNIGRCLPSIGTIAPLGHASFYVNGGKKQLGCYTKAVSSIFTGDVLRTVLSFIMPDLCKHFHAFEYFKASINPGDCQFIGYECEGYQAAIDGACGKKCKDSKSNCAIMGLDWKNQFDDNDTRVYYVETSATCPYCIQQKNNE